MTNSSIPARSECPVPADDHTYAIQYREGWEAMDGEVCPWPASMIGPRCAWLAGYHDRRK